MAWALACTGCAGTTEGNCSLALPTKRSVQNTTTAAAIAHSSRVVSLTGMERP
jgi:hypothetical protein